MNNATARANRRRALPDIVKSTPAVPFFAVFLILALLFVPKFANPENLFNIITQSSDLIILGCGMTFVFINGSIDFSLTAILPLASVLGAKVMTGSESAAMIPLAILVMFAVGAAIGMLNGLCVTRFRMPSFIATMATQLIFSGVALTITQSNSIGGVPAAFNTIAQGSLLGLPVPILLTMLVVALSIFLLLKTVYGRRLMSVGINQRTSYVSGVPVRKTIFSVFLYSGLLASLASIIMSARLGAGVPALGKDMLMDIVAAVVVGGTSVSGGKGNLAGTVIAAILVVMLNNCLNLLAIDWYLINVCKGALILVVALYSTLSARNA